MVNPNQAESLHQKSVVSCIPTIPEFYREILGASTKSRSYDAELSGVYCILTLLHTRFFHQKPRSMPSTKSFLIFGHILVLTVS